MRWSRVALYSLYCVLAVVGIVLVLAFTIDLGRFKEPATALVSDLLQRELEIAGPLHINIGRKVEIYAEDARLASADWAADPDMASLRRLEATVDTWSLIRWPIMVESLTIDGGRLNLELSEERGHSWRFFEGREKIPDDEQAEKKPKKRFRLPVLADDIRLTDTVFTLDSPGRPEPLRISATEINEDLLETDEVQVTLDGDINDTPVALLVTAGGLDNLVEFLDVEFGLNGNLGEITFEGEATFADLLSPIRPVGTVTLVGPSIEYLTDTLELPRITTGPLQLSAEIAPVNDNMQLQLDGTFGEFSLLSDGRFVSLRELQEIDLRVSASGPDAGTIARLLGNEDVPRDPFNVMGVLQRSGSRITVEDITVTIGETQFGVKAHFADFPRPQGANATVRINGPDIGRFTRLFGLPGRLDGPFKMEADLVPLAAGGATVDVSVTARDVELTVGGNLTQEHDLSGTEILVRYRGANLRTITDALNIADAPAEPFDLMARLARVSDGIRLDGGSLTLADDILTFSGMIGNKPLEADTDVTFELVGPNLAELLVDFGRDADELPYAPYRASGRVSTAPGQFLLHDILLAFGESLEYQLNPCGCEGGEPPRNHRRGRHRRHTQRRLRRVGHRRTQAGRLRDRGRPGTVGRRQRHGQWLGRQETAGERHRPGIRPLRPRPQSHTRFVWNRGRAAARRTTQGWRRNPQPRRLFLAARSDGIAGRRQCRAVRAAGCLAGSRRHGHRGARPRRGPEAAAARQRIPAGIRQTVPPGQHAALEGRCGGDPETRIRHRPDPGFGGG
jgi:hypothetical protein